MSMLKRKKQKQEEMNLVPMMNLMTVLIPFLLSITAFAKISTVDVAVSKRGSTPKVPEKIKPIENKEKIKLALLVSDLGITIGAQGGFEPTIFTKEQWKFKDEKKGVFYTVDVDSAILSTMRKDKIIDVAEAGRPMSIKERQDIILNATDKVNADEKGNLVKSVFRVSTNEMLVRKDFSIVSLNDLKIGDEVINLNSYMKFKKLETRIEKLDEEIKTYENEQIIKEKTDERVGLERMKKSIFYVEEITTKDGLVNLPCSAYDVLTTKLLMIKDKYAGAPDIEEIIISCEDAIIYDKIIRLIDLSRSVGFVSVSLSKFRV